MADIADLIDHLRSLGCCVHASKPIFDVARICHVEDAGPETLSWYRGDPDLPVEIGVLVGKDDGSPSPSPRARVVASHSDPRMVMRSVIERFFGSSSEPIVLLGARCRVHPTAVLGADGQSYECINGAWRPFPQVGGLRIGDDVDLGACATVMRGSVGDTVIGPGTKIGNGVNVGHDVRIGRDVLVIAGASIAGWARLEDGAKVWQGALIKNGVRVGVNAQVAMGAVVLEDVPPGEVWAGNPARRIR